MLPHIPQQTSLENKFMRLIFAFVFISLYSISAFSQETGDNEPSHLSDKILIAKGIWDPIFHGIDLENEKVKPKLTKDQFEAINTKFYTIYAKFLSKQELLLQKEVYNTKIGKRIAEDMFRGLFGLGQFSFSYEDFSDKEKLEWESMSKINYNQMKALDTKMQGFIPFLKSNK